MNPAPSELAERECRRLGLDFPEQVALHLRHGRLVSGPDYFIMGRAVCEGWGDALLSDPAVTAPESACDAWFVWLAAGNLSEIPNVLKTCGNPSWRVGFARNGRIRFHDGVRLVRTIGKCRITWIGPPRMTGTRDSSAPAGR